jgi:hypothetical protein
MTSQQIKSAEEHYDDYLRYSQECFGISYTNGNPCDVCDDKKECSKKYFKTHPIGCSIPEKSKTLVDLMKEETIMNLANYGGVNRHLVKAGETWHYHFDRDCTVLLVFDEDE